MIYLVTKQSNILQRAVTIVTIKYLKMHIIKKYQHYIDKQVMVSLCIKYLLVTVSNYNMGSIIRPFLHTFAIIRQQ